MRDSDLNKSSTDVTMPMLFVGHGSPMIALQENEFVTGWQQQLSTIPQPKAILCISAHWETCGISVTHLQKPPTIHDFGGFPEALYQVAYPAPGSPVVAEEIKAMIADQPVSLDEKWGLDHGCWSVLTHLYPKADVPVVQLSLNYRMTPEQHYSFAKELSALRRKGVLVIGSGNIVHNLRLLDWQNPDVGGFDWAQEANDKIGSLILSGDHSSLINYDKLGRSVKMAIPSVEHYLPLLYILGLMQKDDSFELFNNKLVSGSLSMTSLRVG